jgi:hypothetical protein
VTDVAPDSDEQNQGLDYDLGVSLHDWTTRWSQIVEDRDDEPGEALREATQLLDEMARQLRVPTDSPSAPETEEFTRALGALRDLVTRYENEEPADDDEFEDAFVNARDMFDGRPGRRGGWALIGGDPASEAALPPWHEHRIALHRGPQALHDAGYHCPGSGGSSTIRGPWTSTLPRAESRGGCSSYYVGVSFVLR